MSARSGRATARVDRTLRSSASDTCSSSGPVVSRSVRSKYCSHVSLLTDHSSFICDPSNLQTCDIADLVIDSVRQHLHAGCTCIANARARFTIANAKLSQFFLRLQSFASNVGTYEARHCNRFFESGTSADEKSDAGHVTSVRQSKTSSRFDSNPLFQFVNVSQHMELVQPLIEAIEEWDVALRDPGFKTSDASTLRIPEHLLTAFNVCRVYKMLPQQEMCARLARKAAVKPADQLMSHCMDLQLALSIADCELADRSVKQGTGLAAKIKASSETFETALFFLLRCEYEIRRNDFSSAPALTAFITSDYLKKLTVNRFFLKTLAMFMASRYPADAIQASTNFQYFVDPLESTFMLVKRWHRKVFDPLSSEEKKDDMSDPLWFRYATYDLFCNSFILYSRFHINCNIPLESEFFHNVFMKFCRQNCLLFWLRKILVLAAEVDRITDRADEARLKVMNALELGNKRQNRRLPDSGDQTETEDTTCSADDFIVSKAAACAEIDSGHCLHDQNVNVFNLKKKTIELLKNGSEFSEDAEFPATDYFTSEPEDVSIYEFDVMRLEALIELLKITIPVSVRRVNTLTKIGITNNIKISLSMIREVVKKIERPDSTIAGQVFRDSLENGRELISSRQRFHINCLYMESYLALGQHGKALIFANGVLSKKMSQRVDCLEGYCSRVQFAEFCLYYAKLLTVSTKNKRLEFNPAVVAEQYLTRKGAVSILRSASPTRGTRNSHKIPPPQAPKGKQAFKMDEMNEYFKQLGQVTASEQGVVRHESPVRKTAIQMYQNFLRKAEMSPSKNLLTFECSNKSAKGVTGRRQALTLLSESETIRTDSRSLANKTTADCASILTLMTEVSKDGTHGVAELLVKYLGTHPPVHLYRELMSLLSDSCFNAGDILSASYYLSEQVSSAFRYHALKVCYKRMAKKKVLKYPVSHFEFQSSAYCEAIEQTLKACPRGWRILQIVAEDGKKPGPDLLVTRYESGRNPVSLKIRSDEWKHKRNFIEELDEIIELSNNSILNKDPKSFWSLRMSLDTRMRKLVAGVEKAWFGPFIGFMIGKVQNDKYNNLVKETFEIILSIAEQHNFSCLDTGILDLLVESSPVLNEEEFCSGIGMLFSFEDKFMKACFQAVQQMISKFHPLSDPSTIFSDNKTSPIGLMLSQGLELFPWESLPAPRDSGQELFRIPSFRFLSASLEAFNSRSIHTKEVNSRKTYYLLNPTNNLSKTEEKFKEKFADQKGWKGCVGKAPDPLALAKGLEEEDIYIFFGHGAGSVYYRSMPNNLEGVDMGTTSVVIGCSSGRLRHEGKDLEAYGIPYRFLLNGSPAYVGVLWDVTDLDIDAFADDMLSRWMPHWNCKNMIASRRTGVSLCRATAEARQACKLKYLIGAAPVVYGLPIYARASDK